jgi:Fe-S-cluster-containing hydrogenase component 2
LKTYSEQDIKESEDDIPEDINCPHCLERGYKVRLGGRILEPNEPRPADYENCLQCPTCLWICPIFELPKEEEIKDAVETIESPFEQGKFILESIPKRGSAAGRKLSAKKRRNKIKLDPDPEIDA